MPPHTSNGCGSFTFQVAGCLSWTRPQARRTPMRSLASARRLFMVVVGEVDRIWGERRTAGRTGRPERARGWRQGFTCDPLEQRILLSAPEIDPIGNQTVNEGQLVGFCASFSDG